MVGQINYPIGEDEIPRRLAALTQKLEENNAAVVQTVTPIVKEALTARDNIATLFNNLDARVDQAIHHNSYNKTEIENRASTANNGILSPTHGGTGTNNAYNHDVGSTTRRAVWMDTNGNLGYALSSNRGKKDIQPTQITENMLRAIDIVDYRFNDDPEDAPMQIGVIAEQVQTHIPDSMIYTNADSYNEDIDNPEDIQIEGVELTLFGILALRLAQINATKIDKLQKQNHQLQKQNHLLNKRITKLTKRKTTK